MHHVSRKTLFQSHQCFQSDFPVASPHINYRRLLQDISKTQVKLGSNLLSTFGRYKKSTTKYSLYQSPTTYKLNKKNLTMTYPFKIQRFKKHLSPPTRGNTPLTKTKKTDMFVHPTEFSTPKNQLGPSKKEGFV